MAILTHPDILALWKELLTQAETNLDHYLSQMEKNYVADMIIRYTNQPDITRKILAEEFLTGMQLAPAQKKCKLQTVGDTCLLFSGFFPQLAHKRTVTVRYFVELGRSAYANISLFSNDLYALLARHFVMLMEVLQEIPCKAPKLLPLEAFDLWQGVGSQKALKTLQSYTKAPLNPQSGCQIRLKH